MVAFIRTSEWEWPLFFHVLGAMLLVGGVFVAFVALALAWRADGRGGEGDAVALTRFAYRDLFFVVLPAYIVMRIAAEWVRDKAPFDDDAEWIGIGYLASDLGALLILISLILAGIALRRADNGRGRTVSRVITVVTLLLLAAYIVAIWAMTTKPT
jgi:hypothetical protein